MCKKCEKYPAPTSNFPEVGESVERQSTLYKCNSCGAFLEVPALGKAVREISLEVVKKYYPNVLGNDGP